MLSDHLADKLNPIKTRTSSLLHNVTETTTSLDNYLLNRIGNSITSSLNNWLIQHPLIAWLFNHPIIALVSFLLTLVLTIRLLGTVYRVIANTIDRMWLWILRSPWLLFKFLFGWSAKPATANTANTTVTNYEVTNNPEQLQEIIARLDQIQQQQEQIIQDLAQLKQQPLTIEPKQLRLAEKK